ncbi:hypothetical protein BT96DRAFT_1013085 [Gymnopus androsaceus JB14]|uniref:TECPR1-like DysF domain-containing protein n=1 Tax=Gymnopus androsaceus JB14 TaxID=1447944 RepID=A0A6A4II47_9AGAR|nr:hypothetical protein BT96DRAFT_1013085 [Gymnopus androsaceus JB14]
MATLDYISVPSCASRLQNQPLPSAAEFRHAENDIRPAVKLRTTLPNSPSDSSDPTSPIKGFGTSSAFNLLPQMLLSSSLPVGSIPTSDSTSPNDSKSNPARKRLQKLQLEPIVLLSNRDPLSLQITTVNFKRFIERVGPGILATKTEIEEIFVLAKRLEGNWNLAGCIWLFCYFPRLVFILPHLVLIAIILATVHYPVYKPPPPPSPITAETPLPAPIAEDSVDWQANIQAIQNLMGAYADVHIATTPYLSHLSLSPNNPQISKPGPKSPYTLPLLTFLILTLPPSVFLVTSAYFPARLTCFICGAGPVLLLSPELRRWFSQAMSILSYLHLPLPDPVYPSIILPIPSPFRSLASRLFGLSLPHQLTIDPSSFSLARKRVKLRVQRLIDDNNLSDEVWNSEMREVELWENERLDPGANPMSPSSGSLISPTTSRIGSPTTYSKRLSVDESGAPAAPQTPARPPPLPMHQRSRSTFFGSTSLNGGWSKAHLRPNERSAWTRGRDGWSGVAGSGHENDGTVSNLTFSLAPCWEFVPTEGWRADLIGDWVKEKGDEGDPVLGADENGWVYTNDVWLVPANHVYSGAVTRRRRWVRRIWYNLSYQRVDR